MELLLGPGLEPLAPELPELLGGALPELLPVPLDDEPLSPDPLDDGSPLPDVLDDGGASLLLSALEDGNEDEGMDDEPLPLDDPDEPLLLPLDELLPLEELLPLDELLPDELEQHSQQQQPA
jgi:hypothetical protein